MSVIGTDVREIQLAFPRYGSGFLHRLIFAANSPNFCLSVPLSTILVGAGVVTVIPAGISIKTGCAYPNFIFSLSVGNGGKTYGGAPGFDGRAILGICDCRSKKTFGIGSTAPLYPTPTSLRSTLYPSETPLIALLIKLLVRPHKLLCDFSSESWTVTDSPVLLLFRIMGGNIGSVCVPRGPVIVTSR